jgi:hypothetical protein
MPLTAGAEVPPDDRAELEGWPLSIDPMRIVLATLEPPPEQLGVTHWS